MPHLRSIPVLRISFLDRDNDWVDLTDRSFPKCVKYVRVIWAMMRDFVLLIVPRRYFCGGSFCFMSWCLNFFCAGALCMFSYF